MNDRNTLNRDSAETEASARSTEASAEASAESLAKKCVKNRQIFPKLDTRIVPFFLKVKYHLNKFQSISCYQLAVFIRIQIIFEIYLKV